MFLKAVFAQVKYLLKRKEAAITFIILFGMVISNFIRNVLEFQGMDVIEMFHPMKLLLLSYNITNYKADLTIMFTQLYPILVVLPAGFALAKEYQLGENVYMSARLGNKVYKSGKIVAAFLTTAIVFVAPLLMEFVLNCISFPLNATGDLSNWPAYDEGYLKLVDNYFMSDLYKMNPYIYAIAGIMLFGLVSGLISAVTVVISFLIKVKYNIFLFLPSLVLLNLSLIITTDNAPFSFRWYDYLLLFSEPEKNNIFFVIVILIILIFVTAGVCVSHRKDCL